jgi:hypothetical protein
MHWNVYTTDVQNLPPHVSAFRGCHHQGVFTVVKVVLSAVETVRCMQHSESRAHY